MFILLILLVAATAESAENLGMYNCRNGTDVVVHLFEWKWTDVEKECTWLATHGYCAVQLSPANEHRIITDPPFPWYQRYQPVSYRLHSRSGNETEFRRMINTCLAVGVRVYVDGVFNHMTIDGSGFGSGGSFYDTEARNFSAVPYGPDNFHGPDECSAATGNIEDYQNAIEVRNCNLGGLVDLRGCSEYVRDKIAGYMNQLIGWGVAGFRVDAGKHMWPCDLLEIYKKLDNLNSQWFPAGSRPYIYQEVIDLGGEPITSSDYTHLGRITEFKHGLYLGDVFRGNYDHKLADLWNFGEAWGMVNSTDALVFLDNHDNQRGHGAGGFGRILTFFEANLYKMATAFELAWEYGHVRLMSSYNWPRNIVDGKDTNDWIGPPSDPPGVTKDAVCLEGEWICEHRWRQMFNMVRFHNVALGYPVSQWWSNEGDRIAFGRSGRGFIVFNKEDSPFTRTFDTGLPAGQYCDVITCDNNIPPCGNLGGLCRGVFTVDALGQASITVPAGEDPMIALHV